MDSERSFGSRDAPCGIQDYFNRKGLVTEHGEKKKLSLSCRNLSRVQSAPPALEPREGVGKMLGGPELLA